MRPLGSLFGEQRSQPEPLTAFFQLSGRIEGDDSAVAAKVTGRILEVRVREGDSVNTGEVITIDCRCGILCRHDNTSNFICCKPQRTWSSTFAGYGR